MEWLEITASSIEDAKEKALIHLGVHESDAEFEVLSEGKTGLFGRLKEQARVRARVVPTPVRPKENRSRGQASRRSSKRAATKTASPAASTAAPERRSRRAATSVRERKPRAGRSAPSAPDTTKTLDNKEPSKERKQKMDELHSGPTLLEQADIAESFVSGVASTMGVSVSFVRHDLQDGIMRIEAVGDGIGLLVGRRGAAAQAIDELVRTVLQRSGGSIREGKIRIDVGGVRARRAASLTAFARQIAEQVVESGEAVALEPMNRLDRKIMHDAIAEIEDVESRSEGEDPSRRIVIMPIED